MSGARQGRRRRILQEEVISASRELSAYSPDENVSSNSGSQGEGRRYAMPEGSLGEALARRHFPQHAMVPIAVLVGSLLAVAALAVMHAYSASICSVMGDTFLGFIDGTRSTSLATWTASSAMLVTAVLATMILAVRRRRVDDYRGCHRLWRGAVGLAMLLSLDAATNLHQLLADGAGRATGLSLLSGNQGWWLAIGGLACGWVSFRVLSDIKESKFTATLFVSALVTGLLAVVAPLAGLGGIHAAEVGVLAQVGCYLLVATTLVSYMRFLRHDVSAGVASKPQIARTPESKTEGRTVASKKTNTPSTTKQESKVGERDKQARRQSKKDKVTSQISSDESRWTDGSDGYSDSYEDDQPRKLSKSERKRLRKQQAQRRAA